MLDSRGSRLMASIGGRADGEFTFGRLRQLAERDDEAPTEQRDFAVVLADLVAAGQLVQFVRVEAPSGKGGIGDFESLLDVPDTLHDWKTDTELTVTPDHLRVFYRLPRQPAR